MKKCKTCFRFTENWRDAKAKGLTERDGGIHAYRLLPRDGVKTWCNCNGKGKNLTDEQLSPNERGCKYHYPRWRWNLEIWWNWRVRYAVRNFWRFRVRIPLGRRRKPVPLKWVDSYDGRTDTITPNGEPQCPRCGNMPYSTEQCVFCGQRFTAAKGDTC